MPIITLTTDIGKKDYLAGAIKGQLIQMVADTYIVDVTHDLTPFNYPQAAYICRSALKNFPPFCFHIVLVDPFIRGKQHLLLAFHNQQYILCADNGLITMILNEKPEIVVGLPLPNYGRENTVDIIKVFGNAIQKIGTGASIDKLGEPDFEIVEKNPLKPLYGDDWIEGQIIFIDHFENVVVNITRAEFEQHRKGRGFYISFKREAYIDTISNNYADVDEGELLAMFNAADYLEIALNKGNAAGLLGLQGFSETQAAHLQNKLIYQVIRIYFQ